MPSRFPALLSALLLTLPGCTMIPSLPVTDPSVADQYPGGSGGAADGARSASEISWREFVRDPRLRRILDIALTSNRDLRVAMLNVEESRAQYRVQRASDFPTMDAGGSFSRQRNGRVISNQFSANASVSYELDLFGRVRSLNAQALENYLSTAEAARGVRLSLTAEVITQYFNWCQIQEQLALANRTLALVSESRAVTKSMVDAGGSNELDLRSADAQVQSARISIISYERQAAQAENALTLLAGQPLPADLPARRALDSGALLSNPHPGLPSDLVLRRPDILEAEHTLRAANAAIGAARAAFFPSLSLTGSAGSSSVELNDLFGTNTGSWNFSPRLTVPIFSGGANKASLDAAKVRTRTEVARYEKAIQTAFREVADALTANASYRRQLGAQILLIEAQQKRYDLAEARYRQGLDTYLNVLSAQQDLYSSQQSLLQTRADLLINLTALYKALGGGWK
ncbi:MAG: efflux system, outer rane lipoprotein NodT family [Verrucomicrobiales bacterium]|nr:efflux system, outer rane lipoprotein NodT family [Verrucomicrobiales bacterium]